MGYLSDMDEIKENVIIRETLNLFWVLEGLFYFKLFKCELNWLVLLVPNKT